MQAITVLHETWKGEVAWQFDIGLMMACENAIYPGWYLH